MFRSIYRDVERVYEFQSEALVWASRRQGPRPPPPDPEREAAERRRRSPAEPAKFLLPATRAWVAGLPPAVKPAALLREYGRIANLLALAWPDAAQTYRYLHDLLVDRRGSRTGFPVEVQREIETLYRFYVDGWQSRTNLQVSQERRDER